MLDDLAPVAWRCLELAHEALLGRALPVGAVLVNGSGVVVGEGRNEVGGGSSILAGSVLAHAETVAISPVATLLFLLGASERVLAAAEDQDAVALVRSGRADVLGAPSLAEGIARLEDS